jgi:transaldolase
VSVEEVMQLAGVAALTLPPTLLHPLSHTNEPEDKVKDCSLFKHASKVEEQEMERKSFIDDETKYREAFAKSDGGKGKVKTTQVRTEHSVCVVA